jgi:RNA 2',3'-cyclic 3'-phosphodiesterase
MRFFIALEIPESDLEEFKIVQTRLKELLPSIRLTDNPKLHLTLAFIGDKDDKLKEQLIEVVNEAVSDIQPFSITPAYLDGFPSIHNPHTLWVGVKGDVDKLLLIRERIKDGLNALSIGVDERRFTPHIAIAKAQHLEINHEMEEKLQGLMAEGFDPIQISSIKLFESIPDEGFHTHNTLAEIKLV